MSDRTATSARAAPPQPDASFRIEAGADGIGRLVLDVPGSRLNILTAAVFAELRSEAARLAEMRLRALLVVSGKPDNFVAGADIRELSRLDTAAAGTAASRAAQSVLSCVAGLPFPTLAVIHGPCLGGGLELALACTYRVATDDRATALAAPEVQLGLLPGAGGCCRLPRLVGFRAGLDLMLTGRRLDARRAHRIGLVDAVVPAFGAEDHARAWLDRFLRGERPPTRPRGVAHALVDGTRAGRAVVSMLAGRRVRSRSLGLYAAPPLIIEVARRARATTMDAGLVVEAEGFGSLCVANETKALIHLFFAAQEAKKDRDRTGDAPDRAIEIGVLGAGLMGSGIAAVAIERGFRVRLRDLSAQALGRARRSVHEHLAGRASRGRMRPLEAASGTDRLTATTGWEGFRGCGVVIEAVFEDLEVKRSVLAECEAACPDAVFATNTSALPVGRIAERARRPERVVGMHFFSPVPRMPLVEVVASKGADPRAVAAVVRLARDLGKTVIVVGDGPGFYVNRPFSAYVVEALRLLWEGAAVDAVDRAMVSAGFAAGPLQVLDEVGWDVGMHVNGILRDAFGERFRPPFDLDRFAGTPRLGRKSGRGFYLHAGAAHGRPRVDGTVYDGLPGGRARRPVDPRLVQRRLLDSFCVEARRCLEDGVLRSESDGDLGAVMGVGFPPCLGGPFHYTRGGGRAP